MTTVPASSLPPYVGRFAPSPTGLLHAGSLVAALASWLDARAAGGRWLVRIEDADRARCPLGVDAAVLRQLAACGLQSDADVWWQSLREAAYTEALSRLVAAGLAYPCGCTRREIDLALAAAGQAPGRDEERVYPGTCRAGLNGRPARAWRLRVAPGVVPWHDRRLGGQTQDVAAEVGDFVLKRADGMWAYQMAVVVDDAAQGVTHVVRGADLADNTARQIVLQQALDLPTPQYLHTPLVLGSDGHKLSKQHGATPLLLNDPASVTTELRTALLALGMPARSAHPGLDGPALLRQAVADWGHAWGAHNTGPDRP